MDGLISPPKVCRTWCYASRRSPKRNPRCTVTPGYLTSRGMTLEAFCSIIYTER
jgi:hypothetical protein